MFDLISKKKFDAERDARIRAEANAETWRLQVGTLTRQLSEQQERHDKVMADLLDRLAPKPQAMQVFTGAGTPRLSSQQIQNMPAIGRRGVRERNAWAHNAEVREKVEESERGVDARRAELSPEEAQELDAVLAPIV